MPTLKLNSKLQRLITTPKPIKVIIGGRGSGKSIGVGDILIMKMQTEACDLYCLREYQESISQSVHRVLKSSVRDRLDLKGWDIQENKIISPAGNVTAYKGASRNPDSIQSAQDFKYSWFEEAHTASQDSIDKLLPTILRNPGAECWFTANPQSSGDPFSKRFIVPYLKDLNKHGYYEDELHLIIIVNWRDNPWWNEEQEILRAWDFANRDRAVYDWIWEGKFNDSVENSIIKPEWFDAAVDAHKIPHLASVFTPHGARIASHDPFDGGSDAGGFALRHGSIIEIVKSKTEGEIDETCDWATGEATKAGADFFIWDGDGMGRGLKRQIAIAFEGTRTQYHMFLGSASGSGQDNAEEPYLDEYSEKDPSKHQDKPKKYKETYLNNRARYYTDLSRRFRNTYLCVIKGQYINPDDMISLNSDGIEDMISLRSQLCRIPLEQHAGGLIKIMSKDKMKKLKIASPNEGDSIMMSLFAPAIATKHTPLVFDGWN